MNVTVTLILAYMASSVSGVALASGSTAPAPEPVHESPAPYHSPPASPVEGPSPHGGSAESPDPYSGLVRYYDVTDYGAVSDGKTDSSSVSY